MLPFGAVTFLVLALLVEFRDFFTCLPLAALVVVVRLLVFLLLFPLSLVVLLLVALVVAVALLTLVELVEDLVTLFSQARVIDKVKEVAALKQRTGIAVCLKIGNDISNRIRP